MSRNDLIPSDEVHHLQLWKFAAVLSAELGEICRSLLESIRRRPTQETSTFGVVTVRVATKL
jgi:hypothetical protein